MSKQNSILTTAALTVTLFIAATTARTQDLQDVQSQIDKVHAEQVQRQKRDADVLKAFSERLAPKMKEAAIKIGFDLKAAEDEMRLITQEQDAGKQFKLAADYSRKYTPQFKKLIQASGISVADERRQLIAALGLNPATVKPSDTLTIETTGDVEQSPAGAAPPEEDALRGNQFHAHFVKTFSPQDLRAYITPPFTTRPWIWGPESWVDSTAGEATALTRIAWVADHRDAGAVLFGSFTMDRSLNYLRVTAEVENQISLTAWASPGYASAEAFSGFYLKCGGSILAHHGWSLGRVIAPIFGMPTLDGRRPRTMTWEFDLGAFPRPCLIGVSGEASAGAGGIAGAVSSSNTQIRRVTVLAWKK